MFDPVLFCLYQDSSSAISNVGTPEFLICCLTSIILGLVCAFIYMFKHNYSRNFVITLALMPLIVQVVITLVNGNLGAGIAVMGVFNLVRFRSIPGSAKDIGSVFLTMGIGLATGMGYIGVAVILTILVGLVNIIYVLSPLAKGDNTERMLKICVPEDLNYEETFEDVIAKYTNTHELACVTTTNMGSTFNLEYEVKLKNSTDTKAFIDELRTLNGNLKISLGHKPANWSVL
ncbi:MAG: DUF4956 domain-containing protein [Coriobacteriales bacterium]|nr:DUF4956 domain-containing protein [Coriobacteriales bacterium]